MTAKDFEVDAEHLTAGGEYCSYAAESAQNAANALATTDLASGLFGDFAEAEQFHGVVSSVHQQHREQLPAHHETLTAVSAKVAKSVRVFASTDESAAESIGSASQQFG